jgi:hypothetical protein
MTIEIHQREVEALIQRRMAAENFDSVEDVLRYALETAPTRNPNVQDIEETGASIVAAMQRMPFKDVNIEPERLFMRVSDPVEF